MKTMINRNIMKRASYAFTLALLCLAVVYCNHVSLAQATDQKFAFPKRPFKHDGKFGSQYSAEEDTTIVTLDPMPVELSESGKPILLIAAIFGYQGKVPMKPKHISLGFYGYYPQCKFSEKPKMAMLINGERIEFGWNPTGIRERKLDDEGVAFSFNEGSGGPQCDENMFMFISQRNFLKVVNAKNVEVQIDGLKFKLTEANLEALRDLASRMPL